MPKRYVLKTVRTRTHAKTGETFQDVSYYRATIMGIAHEWTHDAAKARTFAGKSLAEVYARNKGVRFGAVVAID